MKMKDNSFEQQWRCLADSYRHARCPMSTAELNREVRRVAWSDLPVSRGHLATKRPARWVWPSVAAACLLAVLVPMTMRNRSDLQTVVVDGEPLYFACNNDCSPAGTLETFKTFIQ